MKRLMIILGVLVLLVSMSGFSAALSSGGIELHPELAVQSSDVSIREVGWFERVFGGIGQKTIYGKGYYVIGEPILLNSQVDTYNIGFCKGAGLVIEFYDSQNKLVGIPQVRNIQNNVKGSTKFAADFGFVPSKTGFYNAVSYVMCYDSRNDFLKNNANEIPDKYPLISYASSSKITFEVREKGGELCTVINKQDHLSCDNGNTIYYFDNCGGKQSFKEFCDNGCANSNSCNTPPPPPPSLPPEQTPDITPSPSPSPSPTQLPTSTPTGTPPPPSCENECESQGIITCVGNQECVKKGDCLVIQGISDYENKCGDNSDDDDLIVEPLTCKEGVKININDDDKCFTYTNIGIIAGILGFVIFVIIVLATPKKKNKR